ncbi:4a-hydroxytetrahydrobiopterin dehydratase [Candidatus Nomurabacteria bacterium]|nr:4a-hydroxytetrahydrobiopterin dehydratase [Candidatus Nomurabacteria bacterium]USN94626.1 MAG: 4a-hydroxytetrahydrobiopterin dehydratase [Candidatus Nomurabacteria bacterium]
MSLKGKKCKACEDKSVMPLTIPRAQEFLKEIPEWEISPDASMISREFVFDSYRRSADFVARVVNLAEEEGHHPDMHFYYGRVLVELTTHSIGGLSENDFILAAKIDANI